MRGPENPRKRLRTEGISPEGPDITPALDYPIERRPLGG
jgi:hypothetical protein